MLYQPKIQSGLKNVLLEYLDHVLDSFFNNGLNRSMDLSHLTKVDIKDDFKGAMTNILKYLSFSPVSIIRGGINGGLAGILIASAALGDNTVDYISDAQNLAIVGAVFDWAHYSMKYTIKYIH